MSKERFLTVMIPIKNEDCELPTYASLVALVSAVPPSASNIDKIYRVGNSTYYRAWFNPTSGFSGDYEYHRVVDREFPYLGNQMDIYDFTYDATRMGNAPTISAQGVMRFADSEGNSLDGLWSQECYVTFGGKKFYLKQIPTVNKSNEDARYKYDLDFVSEDALLESVYLYDVVSPFITEKQVSENYVFSFYGDVKQLVDKINTSLIRSGLASLVRKQVYYGTYPKVVPYLTYEQWTIFNVDPTQLYYDGVFEGEDEMMAFYSIYNSECHGDYNIYLQQYIYENVDGEYTINGYKVVVGKDKYGNAVTTEEKMLSFENDTIHDALQHLYDDFKLQYYITQEKGNNGIFTGNTLIVVGDCEYDFADVDPQTGEYVRDADGIPTTVNPFDYGIEDELLSKEKTNTTDKIVTRITGVGSTENIPWHYPNPCPDGWIKPIFTRGGALIQAVTIGYPVDEGTTVSDSVRYEKFLKNRIGNPIKKGHVVLPIFENNYERISDSVYDSTHTIYLNYKLDVKSMLPTEPRITLFLDYKPNLSKCSIMMASLIRDGSLVYSFSTEETYQNPNSFQTLFINHNGQDKQHLTGGNFYELNVEYDIPTSSFPTSRKFDYEGYHYNPIQIPIEENGFVYGYVSTAENFYGIKDLQPFVIWSRIGGNIVVSECGYSTNGESSGKVTPILRRQGAQYKDKDNGYIYKCYDSESASYGFESPEHINAFSFAPPMDADEWLSTFVDMKLMLYSNVGWYIGDENIRLSEYGLGDPMMYNDPFVTTDIFDSIEFQRVKWLTPQPNLMPEVYIKTDGERRFYNAHNYYPLKRVSAEGADEAIGEEITDVFGLDCVRNPIYKEEETDTDDKHYDFENEYIQSQPKEHVEDFDDEKPTIKGQKNIVNGNELRIDIVQEFAYDATDNNEIWESNEKGNVQGDYKHPYFFAKLRPMGFNIFDMSLQDDMVLSMTTGNCGACNFKIGVDENYRKNPVQVWEYDVYQRQENGTYLKLYNAGDLRRYVYTGNLYYKTSQGEDAYSPVSDYGTLEGSDGWLDDYSSSVHVYERYKYSEEDVKSGRVGNTKKESALHFEGDVVTSGKFIDSQQDTSENYVWVALFKDTDTYGTIMPSVIGEYNDTAYNRYIEPKGIRYKNRADGTYSTLTEEQADKFVLTNIRLPQAYLRKAERNLSRKLVSYMYGHNFQKFNFSFNLSSIFLEENDDVIERLNENSVVYVRHDQKTFRQYVKHYTYKMSNNEASPKISVDMNEELSESKNMMQKMETIQKAASRKAYSKTDVILRQTQDRIYNEVSVAIANTTSSTGSSGRGDDEKSLEWEDF